MMINKIVVSERRNLFPLGWNFGTTFEKNATTLKFIIPPALAELKDRYLLLVNSAGPFKLTLDKNDEVTLDDVVTYDTAAQIQLVLCNGAKKIWRSRSYGITFYPSLDDSGDNPITNSVNMAKEELREKLAEAVAKFFGGDYTETTFDDMTEQIGSAVALNAGEITVDDVSLEDRTILPPEGRNAISKVNVKALKQKTLKVTSNGYYPKTIPGENPDGTVAPPEYWTAVDVDVPAAELTSFAVKPAREAKTYTAADTDKMSTSGKPFNGIYEFTVEAVESDIDDNIKPENIRRGVDILGVQGDLIALEGDYQKRLDEYDVLLSIVEQMTTMPNILTSTYTDAEGNNKLVKVPYLPTKKMTSYSAISNSIEECGLDISSCPSAGNGERSRLLLNGRQKLKKIKLTGIQSVYSMSNFFTGCIFEEIELYQDGDFSPSTQWSKDFYFGVFHYCQNLKSIIGDPLDLSAATNYTNIFRVNYVLQYVRFKPGTIKNDISFSDSPYLYRGKYGEDVNDPGTLLSILNGVRPYASGDNTITVTFHADTKPFLDLWRCKIDPDTGLYVTSDDSNDKTLRTAFTADKGVVIS